MPHHGSSSSLASSACSVQSGCTDKTVDNLSMKEGRCDSVIMDGRYVITLLVLRLLSSFIWHLWLLNYVHTCAGTGSMRALDCKNRPNPFRGCMLNGATGLDFGFMFIFCHSFWWFIDACLLFCVILSFFNTVCEVIGWEDSFWNFMLCVELGVNYITFTQHVYGSVSFYTFLYSMLSVLSCHCHALLQAFSALTLLVRNQEEYPACKNWVMRCWCSKLSGMRCRLFAYGLFDATAIPKPHHLLPHLNPDWFYLSVTSLPSLSWKRGC